MRNPIHGFWGTAINSYELGNFFKTKYSNFYIFDPDTPIGNPPKLPLPIPVQVAFGTPRTAFMENAKTNNGKVVLPMINYHMANAERDQSNAYEPINSMMIDRQSYDPETGTYEFMPFPSRYNLTYNISVWANSYRELESIFHALVQSFTRGETHLKWYPDKKAEPNIFLWMRLTWDGTWSDDTELDGLEEKDTRSVVKATCTFQMNAMIPKAIYRVNVITPFKQISNAGVTPVVGNGGIWLSETVNNGLRNDKLSITFTPTDIPPHP